MLLGTVSLVIEDTPDSQRMRAMLVDGPHIYYANYSPTGCCYLITKQRIKFNVVSQQKIIMVGSCHPGNVWIDRKAELDSSQ